MVRQVALADASHAASELLERGEEFSALGECLETVRRSSRGRVVLVSGEGGVGKTALLRRFCEECSQSARILWGGCDPLFTPRPLGPLLIVAEDAGGELEELVASGVMPHEVVAALVRELRARAPTVFVLEDVHWADEATLDVLRLLARRAESVPSLVVASYRDDELDRAHPLRIVLGELATSQMVARLKLSALSPSAVALLAEPHAVDADELYRKTAGNPFFVTEALAAGADEIPHTVRDAVLARAARLSPVARALLDAVAVVPPQADLWLLESLADDAVDRLEECLSSGMLASVSGGVAFPHELARLAVEESLSPNRKLGLHRKALRALEAPPSGTPDLARLAHHAEAAGEADAVLEFAPAAAARAASVGAHREAAAQYARALRFAEGLRLTPKAELLERRAYACFLSDQLDEAIHAQERALKYRRELGDLRKEADSLRSLSRLLRFVGRVEEAVEAGQQAVALLEALPPGRELALAYNNLSHIYVAIEEAEGTIAWGTRALELAARLDDTENLVYALTNIGVADYLAGAGTEKLELSLERALEAGLEEPAGRAFLSLVVWPLRQRSYELVDRYIEAGVEYCTDRGLDLWRLYLLACRARSELDRGRWTEAVDSAALVLRDPRTAPVPRIYALVVVGLVRARRGDPDVWSQLDEAFALAEPSGELLRVGRGSAARAEAAWLERRHEAVVAETDAALELARRRRAPWAIGELAYWRWRAGIREDVPLGAAEPYALSIRGDWRRAAELWRKIGCPYEAALALGDADDDAALRRAVEDLHRLGAQAAAAIVARRLRERGARGVPRGPRPTTQKNPANLTGREIEVLGLVAQGLRNAQIAQRLVLSEKTIDHHVSAILRKLHVRTRGEASAQAVTLGLVGQDR